MLPISRAVLVLSLALAYFAGQVGNASSAALDAALPDGSGHFYRQANGQGGAGELGYAITDDAGARLWGAFRRLGGPDALGYPSSRRFVWDGFTVQATQRAVLQWRPETGAVAFVNVLDRLHDAGEDAWLQAYRQIPPPLDTAGDTGLSSDAVVARHLALLDSSPAIKARFLRDPAWLDQYGLPMGYADEGTSYVLRAQRAAFQQWKVDVPWAKAGEVTVVNAGDLAKEAGLLPPAATQPEPMPAAQGAATEATATATPASAAPTAPAALARSHDWRAPGFVADVGGVLYDPRCVPLRSIGTNVPNLLYHDGVQRNLEWMRQHHVRWFRVFATGHAPDPTIAPRDAGRAIAAIASLLRAVEAFNATHGPSESIYVLVSLTDYYPPGVPGDLHAFDHPVFATSPVLPAPWFRSGVRQFDFDQEHQKGVERGMPNYEVNYLPWVRQIVASAAGSPALLGWQLGNELKARGSPRNGISSDEAYGWYLGFTRDVVDTIRSFDRNHLIAMGAQYIGELTDWEYRPHDALDPDRVGRYRQLVTAMLGDCGAACWNVWGLTSYDFNPYPLDDAATFSAAGVAVVVTEYGFTLGVPADNVPRFQGDRVTATLGGLARPWQLVDGSAQPSVPGAPGLFARKLVAAVAPWGSPAPGLWATFDTDQGRGITGTPDEAGLWQAWGSLGAALEQANQTAGVSSACMASQSPG